MMFFAAVHESDAHEGHAQRNTRLGVTGCYDFSSPETLQAIVIIKVQW
jgi:hypothetical protein